MPPRPRRAVAGAALLLVLGSVLVYRNPGGRRDLFRPDMPQSVAVRSSPELPQPVVAPSTTSHASIQGWPDQRVQADALHTNAILAGQPKAGTGRAPAEKQKPETPCDKQSRLHERCSLCRSGSPGDGGVEAIGGLCREHCSRQGSGYCGVGDDYVNDGLDCRPCRRWLPGADAAQSMGAGTSGARVAEAAVAHGDGAAPPMLLADDRIDAVCFQPAAAVDSLSGAYMYNCIGGVPCPTFGSLAVAQATCSRDTRCSAVALSVDGASGARFELQSAQPGLSTLPEHEQIPETVLWRVADRSEHNLMLFSSTRTRSFHSL